MNADAVLTNSIQLKQLRAKKAAGCTGGLLSLRRPNTSEVPPIIVTSVPVPRSRQAAGLRRSDRTTFSKPPRCEASDNSLARAWGHGPRPGRAIYRKERRVWRHAVALVIAQAEPALCKGVALHGRSLVEIGGGVVGLRHTEAVFVHEAEQRLRPGISAQRLGRQLVDGPNVIAPGIGSSPARQPVGMSGPASCRRRTKK